MLSHILGSKLKATLLEFFIANPDGKFSLTQVVKRSKLSLGGVHSTLKEFLKYDILNSEHNGKTDVFSLNTENYVVQSMIRIYLITRPEVEEVKEKLLLSMNVLAIFLSTEETDKLTVVGIGKNIMKFGKLKLSYISPEDYVGYDDSKSIPVYEKYVGKLVTPKRSRISKEKIEEWYSDLLMGKEMNSKKWAFKIAYETAFAMARNILGVKKNVSNVDLAKTLEEKIVRRGFCPRNCVRIMRSLLFVKEVGNDYDNASFYIDKVWKGLDNVCKNEFPDMEISYED